MKIAAKHADRAGRSAPLARTPAQAGRWYPADPNFLSRLIDGYFAEMPLGETAECPKAVIAPHGGLIRSGAVTAKAFALWRGRADCVRRAVLLGPSHYYSFPGIALPDSSVFKTPLGELQVDPGARKELARLKFARVFEAAHYPEHAVELLLPFVQRILPSAVIVPLILGGADSSQTAAVLEAVWGGPETVLILSSDLSHGHDYETAQKIDRQTARAIRNFELNKLTADQACGYQCLRGFLKAALRREMRCEIADLRNSSDSTGTEDEVTGYGAFYFFEE